MEVSLHSYYEQSNGLPETTNIIEYSWIELCCPVLVLALHVCMMHAFIFQNIFM